MKFLSLIAPMLAATAAVNKDCNGMPKPEKIEAKVAIRENSDRFSVSKVATFNDSGAYGGERSIFLIKDTVTGAEYFGLSGIGISELGSHSSGKHSASDER